MLTGIQYRILRLISRPRADCAVDSGHQSRARIGALFGNAFLNRIAGKTVIDFGCGEGHEAIEIARHGAKRVIGIDIRQDVLLTASINAAAAAVDSICEFLPSTQEQADVIVCIDGFEHFGDPERVLRDMCNLLVPGGEILAAFGPPWYHPLGGHLFSVFPWAHLLFAEKALLRWRSEFKTDGATHFSEVSGGLNQMTVKRFEQLVRRSPLTCASLETVPIRKLAFLYNALTREFATSVVRCRLLKPAADS